MGFFSALGTSEGEGHVERGRPNVKDSNNGVLVVYDEEGRPWIMGVSKLSDNVHVSLLDFDLSRGAYVPHSNDGGHFMSEVVAKL